MSDPTTLTEAERELSLLLRRAAREYLGLADGDYWPSDVADAQARAVLAARVSTATGDTDREALGRLVREVWVEWAHEQPNPKPTWLVGWDDLPEPDREVDRRIGERLARVGVTAGDDLRDRVTALADLAGEAIAAVGGSHSHWRAGGVGGVCSTCQTANRRQAELSDRLAALTASPVSVVSRRPEHALVDNTSPPALPFTFRLPTNRTPDNDGQRLNTGDHHVDVQVILDPDMEPMGECRQGYGGPVIALREWNEQVFLHEVLHAVTDYVQPPLRAVYPPHGHDVLSRIEVALWETGWRLTTTAPVSVVSRPEATVKAEALREAALAIESVDLYDPLTHDMTMRAANWLRERAVSLAAVPEAGEPS